MGAEITVYLGRVGTMSERITDKRLEAQAARVNRALGFDLPVKYGTEGAIYIYGAYGATAVHRFAEGGGSSDLSGLGTKRETDTFLRGMIAGLGVTGLRHV